MVFSTNLFRDNLRPEVVNDDISGVAVEEVGMAVKFGDTSNCS